MPRRKWSCRRHSSDDKRSLDPEGRVRPHFFFALDGTRQCHRYRHGDPGRVLRIVAGCPDYLILGTTLIESIALRGGSTEVMTLSNRLIAWEAAFGMARDGWQVWFGQGLAHKHVPVSGQFWAEQLLDSSWVSAWVQGGILGLLLFGAFTVVTILRSAFRTRADGPLWLGLAVLLTIIGVFESGLFDASVNFLVFFTVALGSNMRSEPKAPSALSAPSHRVAPF